MSQNNVIPGQKINEAAGDNVALREILQSFANTSNLQTDATNTTSGKNVPQQAKATVSYLKGSYEVQIVNPGAASPVSALQAAQSASNATQNTVIAPVVAIYHQIRVATSPRFSVNDNVQVFGGDTGSTQTYWTLTGLGSGRFYFQIRSSYDGVNWNIWRNANGGQTITKQPGGITTEKTTNGVFGLFTFPGQQLAAFGAGFASDGDTFGVPVELYTSAMQAIAGPNGFASSNGNVAHGILEDSITIVTPSNPAVSGPPDFPTLVSMKYQDGSGNKWSGNANLFAFCYDPLGANVSEETTADGIWVDFVLPGGAHLSIGSGLTADGANIALPATMPWVDGTHMLSIVSPANGLSSSHQARGVAQATITGTTMHCEFGDNSGNLWPSTGNWFAIAWTPGLTFTPVSGGSWLLITLPDGTKIAIGAGGGPAGSSMTLPAGFTSDQMLAIATPASAAAVGHPMSGIVQCAIAGTLLELVYRDESGNYWGGDVNWFAFAWQ